MEMQCGEMQDKTQESGIISVYVLYTGAHDV